MAPTLRPNSSRIFVSWSGGEANIVSGSSEVVEDLLLNQQPNNKTTLESNPILIELPRLPELIAELNRNLTNQLINDQDLNQSLRKNISLETTTLSNTTNTRLKPQSNSTRTHQNSTSSSENTTDNNSTITSSLLGIPNLSTTTTTQSNQTNCNVTTTTKRPGHGSSRKPGSNLKPLPDISDEDLKALRAPSRAPSDDYWLNQIHAVTTPKPYDPKRDCGIRSLPSNEHIGDNEAGSSDSSSSSNRWREARIVGGRNSQSGEFPWSVLIRETSLLGFLVKTKCGGVLIDLKWVLTAAHCKPGRFGSLLVMVGEHDLDPARSYSRANPSSSQSIWQKPVVRKVKRMIIHRDYNPSNFDNDIALLELETPFRIQPNVVPICLPEKGEYS